MCSITKLMFQKLNIYYTSLLLWLLLSSLSSLSSWLWLWLTDVLQTSCCGHEAPAAYIDARDQGWYDSLWSVHHRGYRVTLRFAQGEALWNVSCWKGVRLGWSDSVMKRVLTTCWGMWIEGKAVVNAVDVSRREVIFKVISFLFIDLEMIYCVFRFLLIL